jgi:hypothetical protein
MVVEVKTFFDNWLLNPDRHLGKHRPLRAADSDMFSRKVLNAPPAGALWKMSLAANHRISLDLDLGVRNRQRRNGD